MYITFFKEKTKPFIPTIDFLSILEDPYQAVPEKYVPTTWQKVTYVIPYHLAKNYWEKHKPRHIYWPQASIPFSEIPQHYNHFEIPKRSDPTKLRPIDAPDTALSIIQNQYKSILENTLKIQVHDAAHAYVKQRSIVTERTVHQKNKSNWFLYLDFKDFFPSHNYDYCNAMAEHIYPLAFLEKDQLRFMFEYALLHNSLPQGTPLSPTLTNILMMPIDYGIEHALRDYKDHRLIYTRYADDLCISCRQKFDPNKVIYIIKSILNVWNTPFSLNEDKVKFGSKAGRNYHLGTIINKDNELKPGHKKNQKFRAMIYQFGLHYQEWPLIKVQQMMGLISYYHSIEPEYVDHVLQVYSKRFNTDLLELAKELIAGH